MGSRLEGKTALITGSTGNIGAAIATAFAAEGAHVVISGRNQERGDAVVAEIRAAGGKADLIVVGSHGYRGYKRFLLGSVSQAVAAQAKCSVEIVRQPRIEED